MAYANYFPVFAVLFQIACSAFGDAAVVDNVGIYGGHKIAIEDAPYIASLRLRGVLDPSSFFHTCGASIIDKNFILTAAHCIVPNRDYQVAVATDKVKEGEIHEVDKIIIHEDYNNVTFDYDICLIKLKNALTFGPKVQPIELAKEDEKVPRKSVLKISGWGGTESSRISENLLQAEVKMVSKKKCQKIYIQLMKFITGRMVCAGGKGPDTCQGDSGGPLTLGNQLIGVTSFGTKCGSILPGVYTKVAKFRSWISEKQNALQEK